MNPNEDTTEVKAEKERLDQVRKEREDKAKNLPLPGMFADEAEWRAKYPLINIISISNEITFNIISFVI